jgi:hypothetical protein
MTPTSTEVEIDDVQQSIIRNNYKLTADKIIQILDGVRDDPNKSNRRWVWELMQNAKDVDNIYERVRVEIALTPTSLHFRHNGDPFHISNITGLIQQVSSKASNNSNQSVTGKFGTGFITTHLLASVIHVSGVVSRPGNQYRKFELELDRSGATSEDLLGSISTALDRIQKLDKNEAEFPLLPFYEQRRSPDHYDTEFRYDLTQPENLLAAEAGIADLVHTLPGTLVNLHKLEQVRVCHPNGSIQTYRSEKLAPEIGEATKPIVRYRVVIESNSPEQAPMERCFIAYETDDLRLFTEVTDFTTLTLVPPTGKQPVLYRDFPLIGSERFHFPFTLNGYGFHPNERRDNILLNDESEKPLRNRELLAAAQVAALDFTDWLLSHNARNRYVLANTRLPEVEMAAKVKDWYEAQQTAWRAELLKKPLVETLVGDMELQSVRIPRLHAHAKHEDNLQLWGLSCVFLGGAAVPQHDLVKPWIEAIGITEEIPTWKKRLFLDLEELVQIVESKKWLAAMPMGMVGGNSEDVDIPLLNSLYAFVTVQNQTALLRQYAVVPNQQGKLCKLDTVFVERIDEMIPSEVLDVLESLGLNWRNELLRRDIVLPEYKHQERGLREASAEINRILKDRESAADTLEMAFLSRADAPQILVELLRLTSPNAEDTSFRNNLFRFAKQLLHFEEEVKEVESLKYFSFEKATQLLTLHLNRTISNAKTLDALAVVLAVESVDEARDWLGRYLRFIADSSAYKPLLEFGNIVPNRELKLCAYKELFNYGAPGHPLNEELLDILHKLDPSQPRWMPRLLMDGIGLMLPDAYKFEQLSADLMRIVDGIEYRKEHMLYRDQLLRLIDWCSTHHVLTKNYLAAFEAVSGRIFFIVTIEQSDKSRDFVKLLRKPESISDFAAIVESGADVSKLLQIAKLTSNNAAVLNQVLSFAKQLENDVASFKFLQSIGAAMEDAFYDALKAAGITVTIERGEGTEATVAQIGYQGIGSYDFSVHNHDKTKVFYIELKSYSMDNPMPIRLAQSQTKRAAKGDEPFALCVVGRDRDAHLVDAEYVRKVLDYVKDLQADLTPIAKHIEQLEAIETQKDADVHLDVSALHGSKVFMKHEYIKARRHSFDDLIADITAALQ